MSVDSTSVWDVMKEATASVLDPVLKDILLTILIAHLQENHICDCCSSLIIFCDITRPEVARADATPSLSAALPLFTDPLTASRMREKRWEITVGLSGAWSWHFKPIGTLAAVIA
jgi:hypothetical protein